MNVIGRFLAVVIVAFFCVFAFTSEKNILETMTKINELSTFVSLLKESGLESTLEGDGPFTVFAPTNEAFAAIPRQILDTLKAQPEQLKQLLKYCIVKRDILLNQMQIGPLDTIEGHPVNIDAPNGNVYINDAEIIRRDIKASNGIIHIINKVIVPPNS